MKKIVFTISFVLAIVTTWGQEYFKAIQMNNWPYYIKVNGKKPKKILIAGNYQLTSLIKKINVQGEGLIARSVKHKDIISLEYLKKYQMVYIAPRAKNGEKILQIIKINKLPILIIGEREILYKGGHIWFIKGPRGRLRFQLAQSLPKGVIINKHLRYQAVTNKTRRK